MNERFGPLIDVTALAALLKAPAAQRPMLVDCRFDLAQPERGVADHATAHIPGAVYAHLDHDLSAPRREDGRGGRHPLPSPAGICERFSALGMGSGRPLVAYDQGGGALAARLWWMLRYMGHSAVAVLDGGFKAWLAAGGATESGEVARVPATFTGEPRQALLVEADAVAAAPLLVDSRDAARYRGDDEPLDPVAGHVPGAVNRFFGQNLEAGGVFRPAADLQREFSSLLADTPPAQAVFYCGSGVTACHNLLAMCAAGLPLARLYAGSWSDWCSDAQRPVARGARP